MPGKRILWAVLVVGLAGGAIPARAGDETRMVTVRVDLRKGLGQLDIDKVASLGQGGQSEDPMWEGRAAVVRALRPRLIRLFLQEYFDVLPAKGKYHSETLDKLVDLTRRSGAEPMMCICFKPKLLFPRIDPAAVEPNDWDEWARLIEAMVRHYRERGSKIRYWEVMNEPDIGESGGCPYLFRAENYPPFTKRPPPRFCGPTPRPVSAGRRWPTPPALSGRRCSNTAHASRRRSTLFPGTSTPVTPLRSAARSSASRLPSTKTVASEFTYSAANAMRRPVQSAGTVTCADATPP
jgi:hypothetical protein